MNSFAVVTMLVTAGCLSGYFIPTMAVDECYVCKEEALGTCGKVEPANKVTCVSKNCFQVHVKNKDDKYVGTIRGCSTIKNNDCSDAKGATSELTFIKDTCHHCDAIVINACNDKIYTEPTTAPAPTPSQSPVTDNGSTTSPGNGSTTSPGNGSTTSPGNGHPPSYTGSAMLCALMSSLALARMSYNTAV